MKPYFFILLFWPAMLFAQTTAPSKREPREVIESGGRELIAVLGDHQMARADKVAKLRRALEERIDFPTLSRLAIGPDWKNLSETQAGDFQREFKTHFLNICSSSTDEYSNEEMAVTSQRAEVNGDQTVVARITGHRKTGELRQVAIVEFRMRQKDGRWGVIDVTIEGITLAGVLRTQCQAVMKDGGIDRLIQILRDKNTAAETAAKK